MSPYWAVLSSPWITISGVSVFSGVPLMGACWTVSTGSCVCSIAADRVCSRLTSHHPRLSCVLASSSWSWERLLLWLWGHCNVCLSPCRFALCTSVFHLCIGLIPCSLSTATVTALVTSARIAVALASHSVFTSMVSHTLHCLILSFPTFICCLRSCRLASHRFIAPSHIS